jgi:hypothetical protein
MCRMRAIIFFQCLLIFFMNSQFSFSAGQVRTQNSDESSCSARCVVGATAEESRVERELSKAIEENNLHKVGYYFLESREQFTKHAALMSMHITLALGVFSAGFYSVYSSSVNGFSTSNITVMIVDFIVLGPLNILNIFLRVPAFNLSLKAKEKAKAYLVGKLGAEIFGNIKNLKFNSGGISSLRDLLSVGRDEEAANSGIDFLNVKISLHLQEEDARRLCCCRALRVPLLVREGE